MDILEHFDKEMTKWTFQRGFKAKQRARQYKQDREFVLSYARAFAITTPLFIVGWFIGVAILSI